MSATKKVISILAVVAVFCMGFCFTASAYVSSWSDSDYYNQPSEFSYKQFDNVSVRGSSEFHHLREVDWIECDTYRYDTVTLGLTPRLYWDSAYSNYFGVPFGTFKQDIKYKMVLEFDLQLDHINSADCQPYFKAFDNATISNKSSVENRGHHFTLTMLFKTSDFSSYKSMFENGKVTSGNMSVSYLDIGFSGVSDYSYIGIYNLRLKCEVYEESTAIIDKEKEEAQNSGNSNIDSMTGAMPNNTGGFIDALGGLVDVLSYEGTDSYGWTFPAIKIPSIDGLWSEIQLTEPIDIDFSKAFNLIPENILQLVRTSLTIALIIYCGKELYSTISYALTLKRGED